MLATRLLGETQVTEQTPRSQVAALATEAPWLLVILFTALGFYSVTAPPAQPADAPESAFSADRAIEHVAVIAQTPHPMGSAEIVEVRAYIVDELRELGLEPELHRSTAPDYFGLGSPVEIVNIIARLPGSQANSAIGLMAHYDTVPTTPGANDNSAAVATLLETARAMRSGSPVANDVVLLFTDGEEPSPKFGATAFIEGHPAATDLDFIVNFEAIGGSGASLVAETSGPESWVIDQYATAVEHPAAFSFATEIARLMGDIGTDFDPFRNLGVPGLHFAYMQGSPMYHTPADDIGSVSLRSLQHHGDNALQVAQHFGNLDLSGPHSDDRSAFFTLRPAFVKYPAWLGWPMVLAAAGLISSAFRGSDLSPRRVAAAAGRTLLTVFSASLVATLLWVVVTMVWETPSVLEAYGLLLIIGGVAIWLATRAAGRLEPGYHRAAVALVWILLCLLTLALLPGSSYLFAWPALALGIAANLQESSRNRLLGFALVAAFALPLLTPAVDFFFQFGQPRRGNPDSSIPAVAAVAFLLIALAGSLLRSVWWRPEGS